MKRLLFTFLLFYLLAQARQASLFTSPILAQEEEVQENPLQGVESEAEFVGRSEILERILPYELQGTEQGSAGFLEKLLLKVPFISSLLPQRTSLIQGVFVPGKSFSETTSPEDAFQATAGPEGFANIVRPEDKSFVGTAGGPLDSLKKLFQGGVSDLQKSLLPAEGGVSKKQTQDSIYYSQFAKSPNSQIMTDYFLAAANAQCVPVNLLLAISRRETGAFVFDDATVKKFSVPGWWETADFNTREAGYCNNTCNKPNAGCAPNSDVRGVMQFELKTWNDIKDDVRLSLIGMGEISTDFNYEPHRCNVRDAIIGSAIKIKRDSFTSPNQCTVWDEATVRSVARSYCGACDVQACGDNYCDFVWNLYNDYLGR